jgi:hypothetical protein
MRLINGKRRYSVWAGQPQGTPERVECCVEEVWPSGGNWIPRQCCRKRGHGPDGLYCKQHAKKYMIEESAAQ